ncbi:MAG: acyltransferase family protein [Paucibacter sp.]|nr:acyltransferase family protein [Roseateles sp.]
MLLHEQASSGQLNLRRFYIRRFKRLVPALSAMVASTVLIAVFVLSPTGTQQIAAKTAIGALLIVANQVIATTTGAYFDLPARANPLLNTWSLSVEQQFYLVFPLLLGGCWAIARRSRFAAYAAPACIVLLASLSFGLAVLGSTSAAPAKSWWLGFYSPVPRAWEFAIGTLIALAGSRFAMHAKAARFAALAGLAALLASAWMISEATPFPGPWTAMPVAGAGLMIAAGQGGDNLLSRVLSSRPMVGIGDWSYSIYLWHWPLIVFARTLWPREQRMVLAALALAIAVAIVSYYLVEKPMRTASKLGDPRLAATAAIMLAVPLAMAAGLGIAARSFFWHDALLARMEVIRSLPTGWGDPLCVSRVPVDQRDVQACRWHGSAKGEPVYLIGDSNAMQFSDAVREAGATLGRPVTALGSDGCPFIDVYLRRQSDPRLLAQCRADYMALMDWLERQPAGDVLIASVDRYWRDPDYVISRDLDPSRANPQANAEALNAGLIRTIRALKAAGHAVTLMQTIPHFVVPPYTIEQTICSGWSVIAGSCQPPYVEMPRQFADELQAASRRGIVAAAAATGARVFDLRDFFCSATLCTTRHRGEIDLYMLDGYHLNATGSRLLQNAFVKELATAPLRESDPAD